MNKIVKFLLSPFKHILGLGYGSCKCCGFHWNMVEGYSIQITEHRGCFAICEDCWRSKSDKEIIDAYNKAYDSWLDGDKYNEPLSVKQIGFTRKQMLSSLNKALALRIRKKQSKNIQYK